MKKIMLLVVVFLMLLPSQALAVAFPELKPGMHEVLALANIQSVVFPIDLRFFSVNDDWFSMDVMTFVVPKYSRKNNFPKA